MTRTSIKCFLLTLFISLLISASVFAQKHTYPNNKGPGDPCVNMDFQTCDFTGWVLTQGFVDSNPYTFITPTVTANWGNGAIVGFPPTVSSTQIADQHFIVSPGIDPNAPIQMTCPFSNGSCTAMLGDGMNDRRHASRMSQTFLVSTSNANFSYNYAAVLEDPSGHTLGEKPYFMARIYDQNNNSILCAEYQTIAGDSTPGWVNNGNLQYKDWSTVTVPLQAYIGQNVTVEFTVGDCEQGGHSGYVYIESSCAPLEIIPSDTTICGGSPVTLSAPAPFNGTYLWHPGGQTTSTITVTTPGLYSVDLISSAGCFITLDVNISSGSSSIANFTSDTVCIGGITSFTDISTPIGSFTNWAWDFNNDAIVDDTTQNPSFTFNAPGSFPVKLSVTNAGACTNDTVINVIVSPPPTAAFSFTNGCIGAPTAFTDLSVSNGGTITAWSWNFNNLSSSPAQNPTFTFANIGTYPVTLTVTKNGCSDSTTQNVSVNPYPQVSYTPNATGCAPVCTQFTNSSSISSGSISLFEWDFGDGSASTNQSPNHCFKNSSRVATKSYNITLSATSDYGCKSTITTPNMITVYPIPLASFLMDPTLTDDLNKEISFTDQSQIPSAWNWNFGDGASSNLTNPVHEYAESGTYYVSLFIENQFGCKDTTIQELKIRPTFAVWIPNVFTPDGDGLNDFFSVDGFGLDEIDLRIYDRWGELIKHQIGRKENVSWDGLYKGQLVQQDIYVYKVTATDVLGNTHDYIGRVTLIK